MGHRIISANVKLWFYVTVASVGILAAPRVAIAQAPVPDTLEVELARKTPAHPHYGQYSDSCYVIDGVEARELTLVRGHTYVFHIGEMDSTWIFYISTHHAGGGHQGQSRGLPARPYAYSGDYFPYTPVERTPDSLYYQASPYFFAGGRIFVVDSLPSISRIAAEAAASTLHCRTWLAGSGHRLTIQYALERGGRLRLELFDVVGQLARAVDLGEVVAGQHASGIDIGDFATGFYLYRLTELETSTAASGVVRIVR